MHFYGLFHRDLLEWNGYEIQGDMVIHSRLVIDHTSVASGEEEWPELDTESDVNKLCYT